MTGPGIPAVAALALSVGTTLLSGRALAYQTVMLRDSGSASNRVNIAILGDGYLTSELAQLETDARDALAHIDQEPFYAEYANFINVKLVLSSSSSNVIGNGAPADTLFGLYFGCEGIDRLICIGNDSQVAKVLNQDAPEWNLVAIIANSPVYGGSGGQFVTFTRDARSTQLFIHEAAHQYAGVADEYTEAYPSYPACVADCPEPNVTPTASSWQNLKWNYWVDQSTPLPTPDIEQYANVVGAFEGARYMTTGVYRPQRTCRMRETNRTFCQVCAEAHVLETYRLVSGFDAVTPSASQVSVNAGGSLQLAVVHPQTASNSVQYAWSVDGVAVSGVGPSLTLLGNGLSPGEHTVQVQLADKTTLAGRDDALLNKRQTWAVGIVGPAGTGGAAQAAGGTNAVATGGTNAVAAGGIGQGGSGSIESLGGAGNTTGVAIDPGGGATLLSQEGGVARPARDDGEDLEGATGGCSCSAPAKSSGSSPAWIMGAMLLVPLRRLRRPQR